MSDSRGFSLIELMVVVFIIALLSMVALPSITSYFQVSLNSATREMASTVKETYNATVITGRVHRIVYDFKAAKYWVEGGPATALLDTSESREKEERRKKWAHFTDAAPQSPFAMDKTITRNKLSLPRGVDFEDIVTEQSAEPLTEGLGYTHFFPHGIAEQTIIHLKDQSKHKVSLVISPIVGHTDLYERYLTRKELNAGSGH